MEFIENFFKKIWKTERQRLESSTSCVFYDDHKEYFESFARLCLGSHQGLFIRAVDSLSGVAENTLFLPSSIDLFDSKEKNFRLYSYTIVKTVAAFIVRPNVIQHASQTAQALETLVKMDELNLWIDQHFSEFKLFEAEMDRDFQKIMFGTTDLQDLWMSRRSSRDVFDIKSKEKLHSLTFRQKNNDRLLPALYATVPLILTANSLSRIGGDLALRESKKGTELKKKQNKFKPIKNVSLDDKEVNPVIHSFEKLETLDNYEGGRRFDSGDDELLKHESVMDEVDLSQMTTDGETSTSIYSIDDYGLRGNSSDSEEDLSLKSALFYDEWDYKTFSYKKKYCSLFLKTRLTQEKVFSLETRRKLYSKFIESNRKKFLFFKNESRWLSGKLEGDDIDTSRWSRAYSEMKAKQTPKQDFFLKKEKKDRNAAILFLFDQSLSTDSWIGNARIMDVIKDSLFIAGSSLEGILDEVLVSSSYSVSRKNCIYNTHKDWADRWSDGYDSIFSAEPTGYTRLGPGVRHSIELLRQRKAKKKLLFIITDGKVSDVDPYEGRYGLEDIKKALSEAEQLGIKVIGITLDSDIKSYFRAMFTKYRNLKSANDFSNILFDSLHSVLR